MHRPSWSIGCFFFGFFAVLVCNSALYSFLCSLEQSYILDLPLNWIWSVPHAHFLMMPIFAIFWYSCFLAFYLTKHFLLAVFSAEYFEQLSNAVFHCCSCSFPIYIMDHDDCGCSSQNNWGLYETLCRIYTPHNGQVEATNYVVHEEHECLLLIAPPGWGKSAVMCTAGSMLHGVTLVIVLTLPLQADQCAQITRQPSVLRHLPQTINQWRANFWCRRGCGAMLTKNCAFWQQQHMGFSAPVLNFSAQLLSCPLLL